MNLVDALRKKIDVLEDGDYTPGLRAVLLHIETAFRHLSRGQEASDDTAFTDAIYRTNQAFEGSIKEAYRVLAGQDPAKKRPFDIENYLEKNNTFRSRVLTQLTTYRTEWRNPSTHDYKLDFDESEAFLAIVSVSAFSCLLLDQIAERLSFNSSQVQAETQKVHLAAGLAGSEKKDLLEWVSKLLMQYCLQVSPQPGLHSRQSEAQVVGAIHGFLAAAAPDLQVQTEARISTGKSYRADLLISRNDEKVVVEVKRRMTNLGVENAVDQVETYLFASGLVNGIVMFLPEQPNHMKNEERKASSGNGRILILSPGRASEV